MKTLTDAALLQEIAETDSDDRVREAAFGQLDDQSLLAHLAKGSGEFNLRAVERLTAARYLIDVARHAIGPTVRAAAVAKIDDPSVLRHLGAFDEDATVRRCARRGRTVSDNTCEYLKDALAKLEIAERLADGVAEYGGSLDDVCGAIIADGRFAIHGVVAESGEAEAAAQLPSAPETIGPFSNARTGPRRGYLELLGGRGSRQGPADKLAQPVFYRIKIWRLDTDAYRWTFEERRISMTKDIVAWSISSGGGKESSPAVAESVAPVGR